MNIEILQGIVSYISSSYYHIFNLFRMEAEPEEYFVFIKKAR
jgi:hypothetical protein